ncbi:MAG: hypothetical protein B6D61_06735 [Bacteroidetes bacterium 4484_249]|nr:MAG: hypothetical protein B6D61_06735 [Bacteroidetes bacterium 4484_249]
MNDQNKSKEQLIVELHEARKQYEDLLKSSQMTTGALREIEERYNMLVENNPAAIAVHSEGKIQYVNKRALELLGASMPEQIIGKPVLEFLHPDYHKLVEQRITRMFDDPDYAKKQVEEKYIRLDGQIVDLEVSAFPIYYNGKKSILVVLIDVSERKKAEEELNKLSQSVKQSPNIVVITDKNGRIEYVNPKFTEATGYTFEDVLDKNPRILKSGYTSDEEYNVLWETITSGNEWRGIFRNKKKNGEFYWESAYIAPIKNANNEITHFVAVKDDITKRRKVEEKLEKTEGKYRELFESVDEGILIVNENEEITLVNKAGANIFGCDLEKMVGRNLRDFTTEEEFNKILEQTSIRQQNKSGKYELTITRDDNTNRILSCSINPIFENGKYKGAFGIAIDITEKKRIEEELLKAKNIAEESEQKYRSMYDMFRLMSDNSPDMFWAKDLVRKFIFVNKSICDSLLFAKDTNEPIGKNEMYFVEREQKAHPENNQWFTFGEKCSDSDGIVMKNKKAQRFDEYGNVRGKFLFLDVYKAPLWDHNGKMIGTVGSARIVTKQKEIEKKLKESRKLLEKAQYIAKIGYYSCNIDTGKRIWSKQLYEILGLSIDQEISNDEILSLTHPDDKERFRKAFEFTITNNTELDITFKVLTKKGKLRHLRDRGEIIFDKNTGNKILTGSIQDITEQIIANDELIKAKNKAEESDRLKTAFLANMSHELRTPLNAVLGFSQLLHDNKLVQKEVCEYAGIIQSSGNHLLNIIEDILNFSVIESGEIKLHTEDVNIDDLLNEMLIILKAELKNSDKGHIDVRFIKPEDVKNIVINTDIAKLKQVLLNLLKNAIKFTYNGQIEFGYTIRENQNIEFYVKDTGIGIPEDKYDLIFKRFRQLEESHTRLYGGTGLGLSISKKLVELLNGEIWCESEVGKGSVFYFYLPITFGKKILKTERDVKSFEDVDWTDKTILIAEDEDYSFNLLEILLKKSKAQLLRAKNGYEAVNIFKSNDDIDLVLMDIRMPKMDGFEATRKIKQVKPKIPIIAQTAFALSEDKERIFQCGCEDYIAKPLNWGHLFNKIKKYL